MNKCYPCKKKDVGSKLRRFVSIYINNGTIGEIEYLINILRRMLFNRRLVRKETDQFFPEKIRTSSDRDKLIFMVEKRSLDSGAYVVAHQDVCLCPKPPDEPRVVYPSEQLCVSNENNNANKIELSSGNGVEDKTEDLKIENNNLEMTEKEDEHVVSDDDDLWEDIEDEDEDDLIGE